ncbi:MAG: ribosome small subunit-dependent GTPase A [Vicinamibacteria bacterium]|nr:ribosome small subunit-dependent GTPase A [Vicinamibacteria bacterium]
MLTTLGWTSALQTVFTPYAADGLVPARVSVAYGATFRVVTQDGEYLADSTGRMRHEAQGRRDLPAVGDWVAVKPSTTAGGRATIQAILPRKSVFSRKAAGTDTTEQILATNVDTAFLMTAFDQDLNLRRIERYLAMTWESGAMPVILINKTDLSDQVDTLSADVGGIALGVPVHAISAKHSNGLDALASYLVPGHTLVVLGSSGVGKSTLINRLVGSERLHTQEVRDSDHRGRHTTTHRELIVLPGGALLIDTPGMRELQLWSADAGVKEAFDDVSAIAAECFFADCQHGREPRCAVKRAVEDGRLPAERLGSFHKLRAEQEALTARQDVMAQQVRKKRDKIGARAGRAITRMKGRA